MSSPVRTKLSRKERREKRNDQHKTYGEQKKIESTNNNLVPKEIIPLTDNQRITFDAFEDGKHLLLAGTAGTGKSFLSIYLGIKEILEKQEQKKLVIIRSVVPTRDMGFLPGTNAEKAKVYEAPYYSIFAEIFQRGDAYEYMKKKEVVEFITTSFVRGITIRDSIVIIDEFQNMTAGELHTVFTRIGKNCRVVFAGDLKQTDLTTKKEYSGFSDFIKILKKMKSFSIIEFNKQDIVRSSLVKEYIIAREDLEDFGEIEPIKGF
jgi:phosphate starvation-inducible protein PhoH